MHLVWGVANFCKSVCGIDALRLFSLHQFMKRALFTLGCPAKSLVETPMKPNCSNETGSCVCVITSVDETYGVKYNGISRGSIAQVQPRNDYCYNGNDIDQECNGDTWNGEMINTSNIIEGDT